MSSATIYKNQIISPDKTIIEALKLMDSLDKKLLLLISGNKFIGLLSSGDAQRAIIKNYPLNTPVSEIMRANARVARSGDSLESIKKMMLDFRMEFCPVINSNNEIETIYYWEDVFGDAEVQPVNKFKLPVVIMAGGMGTRLRPLTYIIPKPLIPLKEKTMLEEIFSRFGKYGSTSFFISVNYKADLIKYYLQSKELPYSTDFFIEEKPMGTAGSLSLIKGKINETFFVTNCDILIDEDYAEILKYHRENKNEITIVAAMKHYAIPYGIIVTGENGSLLELQEKPDLTFKINSGMYILEPHLLDEIPADTFFHITHLIEQIKNRHGNIGVFPISEKSWTDMGDWSEYLSKINKP